MNRKTVFLLLFTITLLMISVGTIKAQNKESQVGMLLEKLVSGTWQFEGKSRHGQMTKQESVMAAGPTENSYLGTAKVIVDSSLVSTSSVIYAYHPRRGRWMYTAVTGSGAVQEAEELESGPNYFVFKGTAYRLDGGQTTFVWKVTLMDDNRFLSESMAYHEGSWKDNPSAEYIRVAAEQ